MTETICPPNNLNPLHPYTSDWYIKGKDFFSIHTKIWIELHKNDIERIYTRLWQESCTVLGFDATQKKLSIYAFAEWFAQKLCY